MKRRFLSLVLLVALLAGCGGNPEPASSSECSEEYGEFVEDLCEGDAFEDHFDKKKTTTTKKAKPKKTSTTH